MPAQCVVQFDSGTLSAALSTLTIFTTVQPGIYELHWCAKKLTNDGASSTLGAFTVVHTHPDNTSVSFAAPFIIAAGTVATQNATDSATQTGVCQGIPLILNCKAASVISIAMAYASGTPGNMTYDVHCKLMRWDYN